VLQLIILIAKGIIRSQRSRRILMFYTVLAAMIMMFAGATFLESRLRQHPLLLLGFWAFCGWLTILSALLAIFDLLMLRVIARTAREELKAKYLRPKTEADNDQDRDHADP